MNKRRVIALGFFDGVHIGHGALLKKTYERARELDAVPSAMSFDTHPDTLVFGTPAELLNTMDERKQLMQSLYGIEDVIFCHFDRDMMNMPWEAFVEDYLVKELHACHLVCGHGADRKQPLAHSCRSRQEYTNGCWYYPLMVHDKKRYSLNRSVPDATCV